MNEVNIRLLYIEDDAGLAKLLERRLKRHGYDLDWVCDGISGLERMRSQVYDVVAIDYEMPGLNGLAVLEKMQELDNAPPAIMISGAGDMDTAIAAMKVGAADYVVKTVDGSYLDLLPRIIERVLEKQRLLAQAAAAQMALEDKTQLLSLTLSNIDQGLSVFDGNLRLTTWNELWFKLYEYPQEFAVVGTPYAAFVAFRSQRDAGNSEADIAETLSRASEGTPQVDEYRLSSGVTIETRSSAMPDGGVVMVYTDVTARKRAEEEQRVAAAVIDASAEAMLITDAQFHVERCNPAFEALLGYRRDEVESRSPAIFIADQQECALYEGLRGELQAKGHWRGRAWNRKKDGDVSALQITISGIYDDNQQIGHYVIVYVDVTEQLRQEDMVRHQANHDALTGLPNRNLLLDRMECAIEAAKRDRTGFSVLFIDLDGFKPINDQFGHRAGDMLLKEIARRLLARCRDSDTVARYGGDEFIVLLRNSVEIEAVSAVAAALIKQVAQPVVIDDVTHEVQASVGIALFPDHGQDAQTLLKMADQAMYDAKKAGKARYCFHDSSAQGTSPP